MTTYYNILDTIKNQLLQDNDCNSVTEGSIWEIDLSKQTIAPYAHIQVNNATINERTNVFNLSVFCMDIVDKNPKAATDKFRGNDNEQDVLNTQYAVAARLLELMRRGDLRDNNFALLDGSTPTLESFTERFENFWAGWTVTFDVEVPNEMTICDNVIPSGDCPDSTYLITDLDGNTLYSGSIASGGSNTQAINNATAVLKNTLDTTISTTEILAEGSEDITAPNALVGLEDTDGNVIGGDSFASGTANTMVAPDADYTVQYLNGTLIESGSILSNGSKTVEVPDPVSGGAKSTMLMGSGLQTSYRTGDDKSINAGRENGSFFTLIDANPFGNNDRFTDTLGTQVYANDIVLDWAHRDYENELVLSYYRVERVATSWDDAIDTALALSVPGFASGWYLPNIEELNNLIQMSTDPTVNLYPLTFAPFNLSINTNFWTSTTRPISTSQALKFFNNSTYAFGTVAKTTGGYTHIYARHTTLTELGL